MAKVSMINQDPHASLLLFFDQQPEKYQPFKCAAAPYYFALPNFSPKYPIGLGPEAAIAERKQETSAI